MASLRSASASHALETEHESVTVSLAGRPRSDRSCVSPAATFVISVVALILAIIGLALGIAFLNPRSDIVITRSPVPPAGYKKLGALHAGDGEWVRKPGMPLLASDMQAVTIADTILVMGGFGLRTSAGASKVEGPLNATLAFDSVYERFNDEAVPDLPNTLFRFGAAAVVSPRNPDALATPASAAHRIDTVVVVAGGVTVTGGQATDAVWILKASTDPSNPSADTVTEALSSSSWISGPPLPLATSDLALAAVDGGVLAIGGLDANYNPLAWNWFLAVDPVSRAVGTAWEPRQAMPTARGDIAAVADAAGGHVMVLGGWGGADLAFQAAVESFDVARNTWQSLAPLPYARGDKAAALSLGHVVTVGGEVTSGLSAPCDFDPSQTCAVNEVPVHDTEALLFDFDASATRLHSVEQATWEPKAPHPSARFRFAAAAVNGVIYTFGGHGEGSDALATALVTDEVWALFDVNSVDLWAHTSISG
uniref:Galactose oxidase-like Early set domain-containing protein n=1 Tax=Cafeteria roenbergensis TaxID=33653 RepID=A0A7S0PEM8_CAFRO|mmetsp:Transcript_24226/g.91422  ORF Transcript_24226/g.91422 Transcript_24226/m.91422 type:complete len:481 (+) Transcript_24226:62-1504(+)